MARERGIDHRALARQAVFVDAGAAAGPARAAAAEKGGGDGGSRRGVADTHFTEANQIAVRINRAVAGCDSGEEFLFGQCRLLGEIGGRRFERQRNDAQFRAGALRQLVDRSAAGGEIRHHLRGDLGRIGRDALLGHAVIAGKDQDFDAVEPRRRVALPMRQPGDEVFEPAETLRRLGQHRFALGDRGAGGGMPARQVETDRAQRGK